MGIVLKEFAQVFIIAHAPGIRLLVAHVFAHGNAAHFLAKPFHGMPTFKLKGAGDLRFLNFHQRLFGGDGAQETVIEFREEVLGQFINNALAVR